MPPKPPKIEDHTGARVFMEHGQAADLFATKQTKNLSMKIGLHKGGKEADKLILTSE